MEFTYNNPDRKRENITGVKFKPNPNGPIYILENPVEDDSHDKINNLYVAGIDGIDIGLLETSKETRNPSKFATVIKKRLYGMNENPAVYYKINKGKHVKLNFIPHSTFHIPHF